MIPLIAHTPGEPAGIGPELIVKLAQQHSPACRVVVGDRQLLHSTAQQLALPLKLQAWDQGQRQPTPAGQLYWQEQTLACPVQPGQPDSRNAASLLQGLRCAADMAHQPVAAMVTSPLNKAVINQAGTPFSGHTEFIADYCGSATPVMLLVAGDLRVALATTHLPLRAVPDAITAAVLDHAMTVLAQELTQRFGIRQPRIQVCGLNPHAGEDGHLGHEDNQIIAPAMAAINQRMAGVAEFVGPVPADTAFTPQKLAHCDAVLAMYHDQGLPTLKHAGFGNAVNVTLGLPIIRTSVDHGTALDIAGQGIADIGSLQAAEQLAIDLTQQQQTPHG